MAEIVKKNFQILQKQEDGSLLKLHPETNAELVNVNGTQAGLNSENLQDALKEINDNIKAVTGGGVVTGVKGEAETEYRLGNVNITRENLGLGNVDNTSDEDKPVSTLQQKAIDEAIKSNLTDKLGVASGIAVLDENGHVPSSALPGFVDDVVEVENFETLPTQGESGKIYVCLDSNKTYRWSGSAYVEISASLALGETSSTAYAGDKGAKNAQDISDLTVRVSDVEEDVTAFVNREDGFATAAQGAKADTALQQEDKDELTALISNQSEDIKKVSDDLAAFIAREAGFATAEQGQKAEEALSKVNALGETVDNLDLDAKLNVSDAQSTYATITSLTELGNATNQKFEGAVKAGVYSVVQTNDYGVVVGAGQVLEVGEKDSQPSDSLVVGGLFFREI